MKLLEIVEVLRTKKAKQIAYGVLILLIIVDFLSHATRFIFLEKKSPGSGLYLALSHVC